MSRVGFLKKKYRSFENVKGFFAFEVRFKETDLYIKAKKNLASEAREAVINFRYQLESYIKSHPSFLTSLSPVPTDPLAPEIVKEMISSSSVANVGPMASVAGTIALYVGKALLHLSNEVIVENGGDIYLNTSFPVKVGIFSGKTPFSNRVYIIVDPKKGQHGVCTSSAKIGHSLSFGDADTVTVVANSPSLADALATSLGNRIKKIQDFERVIEPFKNISGFFGALAIVRGKMAIFGDIEIGFLT